MPTANEKNKLSYDKEAYEFGNIGGGIMLLTQKTKDGKYWITVSDIGGLSIDYYNCWDDEEVDLTRPPFLYLGDFDFEDIPDEVKAKIDQSEYRGELYQAIKDFLHEESRLP